MKKLFRSRNFELAAGSLMLLAAFACTVKKTDKPDDLSSTSGSVDWNTVPEVKPVEGPSWLKHLGLSDPMGRLGGQSPSQSGGEEPNLVPGEKHEGRPPGMGMMMRRIYPSLRSNPGDVSALMRETFHLSGSDLYRLNCQSCHGPSGEGSPPEIKSLLGPVQGTSVTFIKERMKKMGHPVSDQFARELASGADSTLRLRLSQGGEKMPPFRHLRGDEVNVLMQYLRTLAGVAERGEKQMLVPQSVARVGEHVVKGTCHICHDATGPGGGRMAMMSGIIPSLASMPEQQSLQQVVRQVEIGSSSMTKMMGGPTMPPLPYITEDEAAAAYLYILEYPPRQ